MKEERLKKKKKDKMVKYKIGWEARREIKGGAWVPSAGVAGGQVLRVLDWGGPGPGSPGRKENKRVQAVLSVGGRRARPRSADRTRSEGAAGGACREVGGGCPET